VMVFFRHTAQAIARRTPPPRALVPVLYSGELALRQRRGPGKCFFSRRAAENAQGSSGGAGRGGGAVPGGASSGRVRVFDPRGTQRCPRVPGERGVRRIKTTSNRTGRAAVPCCPPCTHEPADALCGSAPPAPSARCAFQKGSPTTPPRKRENGGPEPLRKDMRFGAEAIRTKYDEWMDGTKRVGSPWWRP